MLEADYPKVASPAFLPFLLSVCAHLRHFHCRNCHSTSACVSNGADTALKERCLPLLAYLQTTSLENQNVEVF